LFKFLTDKDAKHIKILNDMLKEVEKFKSNKTILMSIIIISNGYEDKKWMLLVQTSKILKITL